MEEMIRRIIDMDKQARQITEDAKKHKFDAESEIQQRRAQIFSEYMERANKRLKLIEEEQKKIGEEIWAETEAKNKRTLERLSEIDARQHQQWVDQLVNRVLNGE